MAKHLMLGTASSNWRLAPDVDVNRLAAQLRDGARNGSVISVACVPADALEVQTVWVNPAQLPWWSIVDLPDPDA